MPVTRTEWTVTAVGTGRQDYSAEAAELIYKGRVFNTAKEAAEDFFTTALSPTNYPRIFRIYMAYNIAAEIYVRRTLGTATVDEYMNSHADVVASAGYMWDITVYSGETINIRADTAGTVLYCLVMEVLL